MTEGLFFMPQQPDASLLCPTTGELCPAKVAIQKNYTDPVEADVAAGLPSWMSDISDDVKRSVKLTELDRWAKLGNCAGVVDGVCSTRESMNEDRTRQTGVRIIRSLIHRKKN